MNSIHFRLTFVASIMSAAVPLAAQPEFPLDRPVLPPAAVSDLGSVPLAAGGTQAFGFLPAFATADMGMYHDEMETKFPYSLGVEPPRDSLRTTTDARIDAWLARMMVGGNAITSQMLIASLDLDAGHDVAAEQIYAKLLADPMTTPMQRVYVMRTVVEALTSNDDTAWTRSHLTLARHYRAQIEAVARKGYSTLHDSLAVLDAIVSAEKSLGKAVERLGKVDSMMVEARRRFHIAAELPWSARSVLWGVGVGHYLTFAGKPQGQARMDSIQAMSRQLVTMTAAEKAMGDNPGQRASEEQGALDDIAHMWDKPIFVHAAPSIPAHAWLNTSDSLYQPVPRTRVLSPGQIHLVLTGQAEEGAMGYFLQHLSPKFPDVAFSMLITTNGAEGDVLVEPAEEVAWRQNILEHIQHITVPVATWAAAKQPSQWGGRLPQNFPLWEGPLPDYRWTRGTTIVDAKGVTRAYCGNPIYEDWDVDNCVVRVLNYLEAEAKGSANPAQAPKDLLPSIRRSTK